MACQDKRILSERSAALQSAEQDQRAYEKAMGLQLGQTVHSQGQAILKQLADDASNQGVKQFAAVHSFSGVSISVWRLSPMYLHEDDKEGDHALVLASDGRVYKTEKVKFRHTYTDRQLFTSDKFYHWVIRNKNAFKVTDKSTGDKSYTDAKRYR